MTWHSAKEYAAKISMMFTDTEAMTEIQRAALKTVSTHRHIVSIYVVIIWISMDNREFHSRRVIYEEKKRVN